MKKIVIIMLCAFFALGCAKKGVVKPTKEEAPGVSAPAGEDMTEPSARFADWAKAPEIGTIYFDYDKSELGEEARNTLKKNAQFMKNNTEQTYIVEGHCDERGTVAYNLALGQRRALAVREYYGKLGVPLSAIATITYGSEKPAVIGSSEDVWAKNRRAETKARPGK